MFFRQRKVCLLMAFVVLFTGCVGGSSIPSTYSVSGHVVDEEGKGLQSVCVVYEGDLSGGVVTDNNGRFVLAGLQGSTEISAVEEGWDFETITVSKKTDGALIKGFRKSYSLTILVEGEGTVEKEEFIVSQELEYYHGASVRLTAIPEAGWSFSHWEGDLEGSKNPVELFVDGHKTITAVFVPSVSLSVTVDGEGVVEVEPEKQSYPQGSLVQLEAIPKAGWRFVRWEMDGDGHEPVIAVEMDDNKNIKAVFEQERYTLAVDTVGEGSIEINPQQEFYYWGSEVTLLAKPAHGWYLEKWDDMANGQLSRSLIIKKDESIIAHFRPISEGFTTVFYGSIIIGSRIHQMSCSITNRLPFGVELTKVQVVDHRGYVTAETTDPELLSNNYLAPNLSVALSISPGLPPYITDVEKWEVHWFIEIAEEQYVIKSSYGTSPWW